MWRNLATHFLRTTRHRASRATFWAMRQWRGDAKNWRQRPAVELTMLWLASRSLVQEKVKNYKMKHLRHCVSAGEPLNEEVIYNWEEATGIVIKGKN